MKCKSRQCFGLLSNFGVQQAVSPSKLNCVIFHFDGQMVLISQNMATHPMGESYVGTL